MALWVQINKSLYPVRNDLSIQHRFDIDLVDIMSTSIIARLLFVKSTNKTVVSASNRC